MRVKIRATSAIFKTEDGTMCSASERVLEYIKPLLGNLLEAEADLPEETLALVKVAERYNVRSLSKYDKLIREGVSPDGWVENIKLDRISLCIMASPLHVEIDARFYPPPGGQYMHKVTRLDPRLAGAFREWLSSPQSKRYLGPLAFAVLACLSRSAVKALVKGDDTKLAKEIEEKSGDERWVSRVAQVARYAAPAIKYPMSTVAFGLVATEDEKGGE